MTAPANETPEMSDALNGNEPIPVARAVNVCFPYGGLKASTLMIAIRRGDLEFEKTGRSYFVTRAGVQRWRAKNRHEPKATATELELREAPRLALIRASVLKGSNRMKKGESF
jgi:hypothetical protein